ncbi:hypothetical protein BV25DRAFT_1842834 [Artomyces pyxidatus]|uniref:Uncharacterized protein n=1 Tax=Artomyces pyxidatus TaxID=48021 RepID=A0ACB8SHW3_9AGAM|nr:hypothetical protein BV25DRAFT_1842834 [Artomyces pyxidatus]
MVQLITFTPTLALALSVSAAPVFDAMIARNAQEVRHITSDPGPAEPASATLFSLSPTDVNAADSGPDNSVNPGPNIDPFIVSHGDVEKRVIVGRTIQQLYDQLAHEIHKGVSKVDRRAPFGIHDTTVELAELSSNSPVGQQPASPSNGTISQRDLGVDTAAVATPLVPLAASPPVAEAIPPVSPLSSSGILQAVAAATGGGATLQDELD